MKRKKQQLLSILLAIIMLITLPTTTYAGRGGQGNGTGDNSSGSSGFVSGGASYTKAAYLIYIVDGSGGIITPVVEAAIFSN